MSACAEYIEMMLPVDDLKGASRAIAPDSGWLDSRGSELAECEAGGPSSRKFKGGNLGSGEAAHGWDQTCQKEADSSVGLR